MIKTQIKVCASCAGKTRYYPQYDNWPFGWTTFPSWPVCYEDLFSLDKAKEYIDDHVDNVTFIKYP